MGLNCTRYGDMASCSLSPWHMAQLVLTMSQLVFAMTQHHDRHSITQTLPLLQFEGVYGLAGGPALVLLPQSHEAGGADQGAD